jgi:hypothetical protein
MSQAFTEYQKLNLQGRGVRMPPEKVAAIFTDPRPQQVIASALRVSQATVSRIKTREMYSRITENLQCT